MGLRVHRPARRKRARNVRLGSFRTRLRRYRVNSVQLGHTETRPHKRAKAAHARSVSQVRSWTPPPFAVDVRSRAPAGNGAHVFRIYRVLTLLSFPCSLHFAGTYSPVPGANTHTLCNACPTARWGNRNIDRSSLSHCVPCEPGRSGTQSGLTDIATACVVCAPGRFQESPESASCEACQAGSYGDKVGQVRAVDACK